MSFACLKLKFLFERYVCFSVKRAGIFLNVFFRATGKLFENPPENPSYAHFASQAINQKINCSIVTVAQQVSFTRDKITGQFKPGDKKFPIPIWK